MERTQLAHRWRFAGARVLPVEKTVPPEKTVPLGLWGKAHDRFEKGLSSHFWVFYVRNKGCYCDDINVLLLIMTAPVAKKRSYLARSSGTTNTAPNQYNSMRYFSRKKNESGWIACFVVFTGSWEAAMAYQQEKVLSRWLSGTVFSSGRIPAKQRVPPAQGPQQSGI